MKSPHALLRAAAAFRRLDWLKPARRPAPLPRTTKCPSWRSNFAYQFEVHPMKENIGISALIVAALAFLVHSGGPGPPPARGKNAQAQTATTTADIEGPWLATRAFFHSPDQPMPRAMASVASVLNCVRSAGMCRGPITTYFGIPSVNRVQFLVATVPDPLHSRVSLLTDSAIQAIQEGADASDWIFANQWLPWIDEANPEETDPDKRRSERKAVREQEKQPGILVFRRARPRSGPYSGAPFSDEVLMVFLVGETPTAGVNPAQFELARAYMRSIHGPEDEVRILGPTFSGSFYSLADLLVDDEKYHPVKTYRVRSGTVTGARDAASFRDSFGLFARDRYALDFRSATASTDDQDCYFNKALDDLGIKAERAASLIEDESAFGNAAALTSVKGRSCWGVGGPIEAQPIRVYRFPRDISHLRNSYRDAVTAAKAGNGAAPDIEFSIKDPEKGEDSIPIFSGSQTPLSQYGIVNRIAAAIRGDDVRLVQISATNTLDMLFLAGFLRRQCPDTRLILNYPDVLLVQAAQSEPLTGTLILASYPGFAAANGWMGSQQTMRPLIFSDGNSEGVYNAIHARRLSLARLAASSELAIDARSPRFSSGGRFSSRSDERRQRELVSTGPGGRQGRAHQIAPGAARLADRHGSYRIPVPLTLCMDRVDFDTRALRNGCPILISAAHRGGG
jgi:hypothetical protein